ncbi:hypothetical protein [Euryhalocaulis caribicus]|uniref:hypothetical protein n=1 Tax=Euryhalocaulis caribicus TaxID=1161401 RepID=UPI0003B39560|nr:hypothetical protein [Euryhalocaulis caribicus]
MDQKFFARSEAALAEAERFLQELEQEQDLARQAAAWANFLNHFKRSVVRLSDATNQTGTKNWSNAYQNENKSDPLISYLIQAKNADEHGVHEVSKQELGHTAINLTGDTYIRNLVIDGDRIYGDGYGAPLAVTVVPPHLELVNIENRGRVYRVPRFHRGKRLTELTPLTAGQTACAWMSKKLNEARQLE